MQHKFPFFFFLFVLFGLTTNNTAQAVFTIHPTVATNLEIRSFDGLAENTIYQGKLAAGKKVEIATAYQGLALLILENGQQYPLLINDTSFEVTIAPAAVPVISGSKANDALYRALKDNTPVPADFPFARLMIQAKDLLESSHAIRTVKELTAKRKEFQEFVKTHYQQLRYSDMVRRLIGQYFMMHEYVAYHEQKEPVKTKRITHQDAVLSGVGAWLELFRPFTSRQKTVNYCVSLYYNRSMVTLAHRIVETFPNDAFCTGIEKKKFTFPSTLAIIEHDGKQPIPLADFKGDRHFAFVSVDCPVSMVETVIKARQMAERKNGQPLFVVPLEPLSSRHLAMNRMVSNGRILFVKDEKWRRKNLTRKIRLPLFIRK